MKPYPSLVLCAALLAYPVVARAERPDACRFEDDFAAGQRHWRPYFEGGTWSIGGGVLKTHSREENASRVAKLAPMADAWIEVDVRVSPKTRKNVGLVLRAQDDRTLLALRYYDRYDRLELLTYDKGRVTQIPGHAGKAGLRPGRWYRLAAAAVEDLVFGKIWPVGEAEPPWQVRFRVTHQRPGRVGLIAQDQTLAEFKNVRVRWGDELKDLRQTLERERQARLERLREKLSLRVEPTPFVLKTTEAPARRLEVRLEADGKPEPVSGELSVAFGTTRRSVSIEPSAFKKGVYRLTVPEPSDPTELKVSFEAEFGKRLTATCVVKPARRWTFYMTPHTHYDIGYTHPQPEVIERLSSNLDLAVKYCHDTADWPAESRYRWTIEVTGLVKNYIERHTPEQVERLMALVRQGRIEICGFYLNMPTELVGHEELIRCLYYAEELRDRYGVTIDTAMIDDVPGYAWALPELFVEAGIRRVSFRANSIRGQFLWYRPGAAKRPFYWQGPDGSKVFFWYTDSYREGNFFRAPGLHEDAFWNVIRRNEAAGCTVDDIQLRMGGDNLPPDINASKNARAWNETYVWPKVVVATNREFLNVLERRYGSACATHRGDIPSWWAEGPASSARETGMTRLVHDKLVAAEFLHALCWLRDPSADMPRETIHLAYDKMLHFDEHTWGASGSVDRPESTETLEQWRWKAANAYEAKRLTDELYDGALRRLCGQAGGKTGRRVVVWNTLAWPRTEAVEIPMAGTPLEGATAVSVVDARGGRRVPAQLAPDGETVVFLAEYIPGFSYACFDITEREGQAAQPTPTQPTALENARYRIEVSPDRAGLTSWYDKTLRRELLDAKAPYRGNQAIYETPVGGRDAINRKQPVAFKRTPARSGKLVAHTVGPVFSELTIATSLPTCPRIEQRVRLYNRLDVVDVTNVVTKTETVDPEGVYFAFPFNVPSPEIRLHIANAVMRPGKDQLPLTCHDFYSIQHWADVAGDGFGVVLTPIDAPLVVVSDMNVYTWADKLAFNTGHLYSLVMNNYWYTNFKASQDGTLTFRYRLTAYAGPHDPIRATQTSWGPFHPLRAVWLPESGGEVPTSSQPLLTLAGDPVIVSCVKVAESDDALIVRLLEMRGKPADCRLTFSLPAGRTVARAFAANVVERPSGPLKTDGNTVSVRLGANEIATIGVIPSGL